jgi:cyclophilin family peptidyl-prolyl cis-trans isomerase
MTKKTFSFVLILITLFNINGLAQKKKKQTKVLISTSYGDMKLVLYNETPKHRDNFIKLVKEGFYDSTLFHRVIQTFMIQGGDPESKNAKATKMLGNGGPGYTLPAEINPKIIHKRGALSAARMGDNVNPMRESSGSQFYIVQGKKSTQEELEQIGKRNGIVYTDEQIKEYTTNGGTPFLDMNYTVFGELLEGFDVIDKIAAVKKGRADRPKEDVAMTMKIVKK